MNSLITLDSTHDNSLQQKSSGLGLTARVLETVDAVLGRFTVMGLNLLHVPRAYQDDECKFAPASRTTAYGPWAA